jgi:hypothetical protein
VAAELTALTKPYCLLYSGAYASLSLESESTKFGNLNGGNKEEMSLRFGKLIAFAELNERLPLCGALDGLALALLQLNRFVLILLQNLLVGAKGWISHCQLPPTSNTNTPA